MEPTCSVPAAGRAPFANSFPATACAAPGSPAERRPAVAAAQGVSALVRWAFYGFVFSLFFEYPQRVSLPVEVPTITGCFFLLVALFHAGICFGSAPPAPLKCLAIYLGLWVTMAMFSEHPAGGKGPLPATVSCSLLLTQIVLLSWAAYNLLLRSEEIAKTTLWVLVAGSVSLRLFALLHLVPSYWFEGRLYILGQNPNTMAHHTTLGLVALIGLATARKSGARWPIILVAPCAAVLLYTIVQSGSRGGVTTAAVGVLALAFQGGGFGHQTRAVLVCLLAGGFLYWAVEQSPTMTQRYEKTFSDGDMAGREELYPNAWQMFLEKPLLGWGPIDNWDELGRRAPMRRADHPEGEREPHNLVLEVLTATGLTGAVPIFLSLVLCTWAAWRARAGVRGAMPLAMVVTVFVVNMSGNFLLVSKLDWIVLAYVAASGNLAQVRRIRWAGARVDGSPDQLAASTASLGLRNGLKRPTNPPADAELERPLQQQGEPT